MYHFMNYFVTFVLNSRSRHAASHHLRCWCAHHTGLIDGVIEAYKLWNAKQRRRIGFLTCSPITLCPAGCKMCSIIPLECSHRRLRLSAPNHAVEFLPVAFTTGAGSVALHCACACNGPAPSYVLLLYHLQERKKEQVLFLYWSISLNIKPTQTSFQNQW